MILWKEILQPIQVIISPEDTLLEVLIALEQNEAEIAFVHKAKRWLGYIDRDHLLKQLTTHSNLHQPIQYRIDVLKVPEHVHVESYHNISVVLGMDVEGAVTGYSTVKQAKSRINQIQLEHMNGILNGAGVGVITTNENLEIQFINETAEKILGLSRSFLLYRNYKTLLTVDRDLEEVLQGERFVSVNSSLNFKQISGNFTPLFLDGKITGLVHIFFLREEFEEAVQELEFVRNLYSDLQAVYSSSHEQILVVNPEGKIIRLAGSFLKEFWMLDSSDDVIGQTVKQFESRGIFQPNIVELCLKKKQKLTSIQETIYGRKIWSVATPIYHKDKLEKIVIVSRDITKTNQLKEKLKLARKANDAYKQEIDELQAKNQFSRSLIYRSRIMEDLVDEMKLIAQVDSTVLLTGESGVGKEVFARAIHETSRRRDQPLIRVNCGAIPDNLIESELFGYERGAFTGADQKGKPGFFELANGGTIFLDEIAELPLSMQVKLLRVLQEREVTRVGGTRTIQMDVRVIAATNQNIKELVNEGRFREDLYYRLNVIPLRIPPLRERTEDVVSLCLHFLQQFNRTYEKDKNLSREALEVLESYDWPGNVRELQNIIERLLVTSRKEFIQQQDVLSVLYGDSKATRSKPMVYEIMPLKEAVKELENQLIELGLKKYGTASKVSEVLGVSQATISRRIQKMIR
ncbi:sigma 54-interacting transcriptional regulator [Ammoniphilus sp. CFH 90114]|uniref:sigma 54-interacting transcriptional regulator n=1 Tax=Ammoniphilus sp. CFH 90114 TaxID=2493665 RepID=UPI00100E598C|nr:sigma 54-interacting transcriptional regulator [Ammoniphilus sp. CFH 90114]RXT06405.1 PAS domain-containing protein [Ammoniphilus sp. CFH 90114]